ncbi:MAG: hypothetical protein QOF78_3930, partial [Phycisphaerales bacterium]|nr:hypothetical protein [Phycisphaerales bacterium]
MFGTPLARGRRGSVSANDATREKELTVWIVRLALRRPYTFVVVSLLIAVLGILSIVSMPTDIFPHINIPVVSVIWSYGGLSPEEMQDRITTVVERAMT